MGSIFLDKVKKYKDSLAGQEIEFQKIANSPFFSEYLKNIMSALLKDRAMPMKLELVDRYNEKGITAAKINGKFIYINTENEIVEDYTSYQNKVFCIIGYLIREIGHVLYLDLREENRAIKELRSGRIPFQEKFVPGEKDEETYRSMLNAVENPELAGIFVQLYTNLANVISDYHDEECLCQEGGAFMRQAVMTLREGLFSKTVPLETMMEDKSYQALTIILSLFLQYARYGKVLVLREETYKSSFFLFVLEKSQKYIDTAKNAVTVEEKFLAINSIVLALWPYIEIVLLKEESGEEAPGGGKDEGLQTESSECEDECEDCDSCGPKEQDEEDNGQGGGECAEEGAPQMGDPVVKQMQKAMGSCGGDSFSTPPATIMKSGFQQPMPRDTSEREQQEPYEPDPTDDPGKVLDRVLEDIEAEIMAEMAEELAAEDVQSEAMARIRTGNVYSVHFGIQTNIQKAKVAPGDREYYENIVKDNISFIKKIEKEIAKIIQEEEIAIQKHRYVGRRLDAKSAYKVDQRYFMKKRNPEKVIDMAISILVDNSGSMEGERIESAKKAAVLLTEVLERMDIPVMVASHCSESALMFRIYKDFDDTKKAKYSINRMMPGGDNRDGMALEVAGNYLAEREEKDKLLIIISDGQPNSHGYSGALAKQDIRGVVRTFKRKNIKTLAFAIGDDKPQIKDIYGEAYIDISDYDKFPKTLSKMIEREIVQSI